MTVGRPAPIRDLGRLLAGLDPVLDPTTYLWCSVIGPVAAGLRPVVTVAEDEGTTLVLAEPAARAAGLPGGFPSRRITLRVASALDSVGLTAAVAGALTEAGIPANVVAGFHHDHLFVPGEQAETALAILNRLAQG